MVEKVNFWGVYPWVGVVREGCVKFFQQTSTLAMWLVYMNFLGIVG